MLEVKANHGERSLAGFSPPGHEELDMTEYHPNLKI